MSTDPWSIPQLDAALTQAYHLRVFAMEPLGRVSRLVTDRGPRLAVFLDRPPEALDLVGSVYDFLAERRWGRAPRSIPALSGERFLSLGPRQHLLLTSILPGRPTNAAKRGFPAAAAELLADYHGVAGDVPLSPTAPGRDYAGWCDEARDRLADLEAYSLVGRHRLHRGRFDQLFSSLASETRDSAGEAVERLARACTRNPGAPRGVCAGEIALSELICVGGGLPTRGLLGFLALPGCVAEPPPADLARLVRQVLQARGWHPNPGWSAIAAYAGQRPLSPADAEFILAYLSFPFEVWQTADRYYRRKQVVAEREAVSLLQSIIDEREAREACVSELARRLRAGC